MDTHCQYHAVQVAGHSASVTVRFVSPQDRTEPVPPTILALHGFTGSAEDFGPLQATEAGRRLNWICPDFMGHGRSASPENPAPYTLVMAMDLIDQARQLAPDPDNVLLLGYSMGGRLALHYLIRSRPLPAILIGSSPGLATAGERSARRDADAAWIRMLDTSTLGAFCEAWEHQSLIAPQTQLDEPLRAQLAARRRTNDPVGLANSLRACGTGALPSLWDRLGEMPPVILVFGARDSKFKEITSRMAAVNPGFKPVPIPDVGHAPHLEAPEAVANCIVASGLL